MKRILIVANNLEIGGAERALINMLSEFDYSDNRIDLFLFRQEGEFMDFLPPEVNLLPVIAEYTCYGIPLVQVLKSRQLMMTYGRLIGKIASGLYMRVNGINGASSCPILYSFLYTKKYLPMISNQKYDMVIGFTVPYYVVDEKTIGTKKTVWIHTDYAYESADIKRELQSWAVYDYIVSISDAVTDSFLKKYPSLEKQISRIDNVISEKAIWNQAKQFNVEHEMPKDDSLILLSVGRFSNAKNFDSIPEICKRIRKDGINVKWYLIGYGPDEELIRSRIKQCGMEDYVIILGKKSNPYPYMLACDYYIQPSRYEGKCVSVIEAQILHKPVIITNYATSSSQLEDGVDGVIVPLETMECADKIAEIISTPSFRQKLIENTKIKSYSNSGELRKLYSLME